MFLCIIYLITFNLESQFSLDCNLTFPFKLYSKREGPFVKCLLKGMDSMQADSPLNHSPERRKTERSQRKESGSQSRRGERICFITAK